MSAYSSNMAASVFPGVRLLSIGDANGDIQRHSEQQPLRLELKSSPEAALINLSNGECLWKPRASASGNLRSANARAANHAELAARAIPHKERAQPSAWTGAAPTLRRGSGCVRLRPRSAGTFRPQ